MRNPSLLRSIPFLLLTVLSLASAAFGGWLVTDQISSMTAALLGGTATGVEVYAGQSWVVVGGALLAAGIIGLFLAFALGAAKALLPRPAVEPVAPAEQTAHDESAAPAMHSMYEGTNETSADEAVPSAAASAR